MPRRGTIQVNVTFRRDEAALYRHLVTVAGRKGVSGYIKSLILEDMLRMSGISSLATQIVLEKVFREWAWCERCGTHAELRKVEEIPEGIRAIYWCSDCGMGYNKVLRRSQIAGFEEVREILDRVRETISEGARRRHEALLEFARSLGSRREAEDRAKQSNT